MQMNISGTNYKLLNLHCLGQLDKPNAYLLTISNDIVSKLKFWYRSITSEQMLVHSAPPFWITGPFYLIFSNSSALFLLLARYVPNVA